MDALYIINAKNKDVLISKEFKNKDNNLKLQLFLIEFNNIIKNEKSPFILIEGSIFVYLPQGDLDDETVIYIALVTDDVKIIF
jgi:hypothetical protein